MFTHDLPASEIAALSDVNRPTINQRFFKLRPRIAQLCDASSPFSSEVEGDESSFGTRRVRGKRGVEAGVKQSSSESWNGRERSHGDRPGCLQEAATGRDSGPGSPASEGLQWAGGYVGYQKHLRVHQV